MASIMDFFRRHGHPSRRKLIQQDKRMREDLTEEQLDKMLKDSFPASDPAARY